MADVKWIKITTTMFDDEKIDFIESLPESDAILIIWIKLLTLAGKCNASGYIFLTETIPYTDEMLAHKFRRPLNVVRLALKTFTNLKMIEVDGNNHIRIANWEKHQNVEGMERVRQLNRERNKEYRERKRLELLGEPQEKNDVIVTSRDGTDIDIEIDKDKEKKKRVAEFVTLTETQIKKLVEKHGQAATQWFIETLNNYKGSKGTKYKSDYHAILKWVVKAYEKESTKAPTTSPSAVVDSQFVNRYGFE